MESVTRKFNELNDLLNQNLPLVERLDLINILAEHHVFNCDIKLGTGVVQLSAYDYMELMSDDRFKAAESIGESDRPRIISYNGFNFRVNND